jgi:CXXX repeat modification system protein
MEAIEIKKKLSTEETEALQKIYQRKMALLELMPTVKSPMDKESLDYLYEKIVNDLQETNQKIKDWWLNTSKAQGLEYGEEYSWRVNFQEQEVTIMRTKTSMEC